MTNFGFDDESEKKENALDKSTAEVQQLLVKKIISSRVFKKRSLKLYSMLYPIIPLRKFLMFEIENSKHINGNHRDKLIKALKSVNETAKENRLMEKILRFRGGGI